MRTFLDSVRRAYAEKVREHGNDPRATYQNNLLTMHLRYARLLANLGIDAGEAPFSIHDVGCGTCELHAYLQERGVAHEFSGTDLALEMIEQASVRFPDVVLELGELAPSPPRSHDFLVLSGTFNLPADADRDTWGEYCFELVETMYSRCRRAVAFNVLSTHRTFTDPTLHYIDPWSMAAFCARKLSRFVTVDHAYPLFEATITVWRPEHTRAHHPQDGLGKYFRHDLPETAS